MFMPIMNASTSLWAARMMGLKVSGWDLNRWRHRSGIRSYRSESNTSESGTSRTRSHRVVLTYAIAAVVYDHTAS